MKEQDNLEMTKSLWNKPVLTILVRNNPEENILTACKMRNAAGPNNGNFSCLIDQGNICNFCAIQGNS